MSQNTVWDSLEFEKLDFGYDRISAELSTEPRFVSGLNGYVTLGGKLCKRLGNTLLSGTNKTGKRIDRLWLYETNETPPKVYFVASMYDLSMASWGMYYINLADVSPTWTAFTNLRSINNSTRAHEGVSSRGLFYVKGYPSEASGELLGTVVFDGSSDSISTTPIKFWGILPPTVPAALVGAINKTTSALDTSATTLNVNTSTGFPAAPFYYQLDFETVQVTSIGTGTNWTIARAQLGTTAASHDIGTLGIYRNWSASAHQVDVNVTWAYTYAYKTSTGQISNRAPLETNPDKLPSRTGPFQDLIPKFTVTGQADTVNIPKIVIFRSTDGGGTFFELEEITNTGAGSITYQDKSFASGSAGTTLQDPVPDSQLNTGTVATTLTSNSPPPTVIAPKVTGVDVPMASTPIAFYSSRLWVGIGNIVFYSGDEEITLGIPEECWPSGTNGNFFRFQYQVTDVLPTTSALYVFTVQTTYEITGTNKETFNVRPVFENFGAPYGQPRAGTRYEDALIILTQDYRIARIQDTQSEVLSDFLGTDILDAVNAGALVDIKYWGDLEREWIIVAAHRTDNATLSKQWIFDIKKSKIIDKPFWFVPWNMPISAQVTGRISNTSSQRNWICAMYNSNSGGSTCLVKVDSTGQTISDYYITASQGYAFNVTTNQFITPSGNHVNKLRAPGITPDLYGVALDRLLFDGDADPTIQYYLDDLWTTPIEPKGIQDPWRRRPSKGYKTMVFGINKVCQHVAFTFDKVSSTEPFECENFIILFAPDSGV